MFEEGTISHAAGDLVGLGIFAVVSGVVLHGAKKVSDKVSKKGDIKWFG
jgi:hypothetical protein